MIRQGNKWAHGGDAVVECLLYRGIRPRNDPYDFELLYGFLPPVVECLRKQETINALNIYATVQASDRKYGTESFYQSF
ncbi:hypothetical protein B9Z19DRAFT_1092747 [Tuber borchii]|uniref:Uncharacterized protein n=1 Tax=Tuber borchii TaxID=42251 RepID=A0A2T6ZG51_TUBBO|nr:hypothetical protein B9Z19DRAFT_1092747 [Tuber borchii]